MRQITVTVTVYDSDHLPHGITPDDVAEEVREVVKGVWISGTSGTVADTC